MALRGCHGAIKYGMFIFNLLFWLMGGFIFAIGVWMRTDPAFTNLIFGPNDLLYDNAEAYILITLGLVVMVIGFCGCLGAIVENRCLLAVFFVFMFVIFAVLLVGGIVIYVSSKSVSDKVTSTLKQAAKDYKNNTASKLMVDFVQFQFNCCAIVDDTNSTTSGVET